MRRRGALIRAAASTQTFGAYLEYILTKPLKYLVRGLIVNVGILFAASLLLLVAIAWDYKGRCGDLFGEGRPCTFLEYMKQEVPFSLMLILLYFWWLILLSFVVIPGIGYLIGRRLNSLKPN
jgi:hypothetical protein